MNVERARAYLLKLPHVLEAEQWGGLLCWVGDKAIGGKTCAMLNLEPGHGHPMMFPAGAERFHELCEMDGVIPAPYLARGFWVAVTRWNALRDREWEELLTAAYGLTLEKLPKKTRTLLELPGAELKTLISERKKLLAGRTRDKQNADKTDKSR